MTTFLLSAKVTASDDLNQYGLGTEGLNLSLEKRSQKKNTAALRSPETLSNYQFIKDFETDYLKYTVELETDKTRAQQQSQGIDKPILQLDVEYQDTAVDFNSPYHAVNSDLNNQLN
ncbi:MAG: hypothetical protein OQL19_16995, partial [Gammaproteobacteria bacterium]|nr:hypothetical protein [Gammaproteobacteria bacterium]